MMLMGKLKEKVREEDLQKLAGRSQRNYQKVTRRATSTCWGKVNSQVPVHPQSVLPANLRLAVPTLTPASVM
ncbi:hypothetical protein LAZ67_15000327 [Cordylochernes scorpioides]|uniref:Uncharacterized protein n=1 Tax=Cordylochernes scorpioides TaxID=51811 RepID=A0ABY6L810_9ARAC|nr:hypothetical protein LAZ67_15000327 [Cordylochernes scorpioides]